MLELLFELMKYIICMSIYKISVFSRCVYRWALFHMSSNDHLNEITCWSDLVKNWWSYGQLKKGPLAEKFQFHHRFKKKKKKKYWPSETELMIEHLSLAYHHYSVFLPNLKIDAQWFIEYAFTCEIASLIPFVKPTPVSWVFRSVLITSNGVVNADATAPAVPPANTCTKGLYFRSLFNWKFHMNNILLRTCVVVHFAPNG